MGGVGGLAGLQDWLLLIGSLARLLLSIVSAYASLKLVEASLRVRSLLWVASFSWRLWRAGVPRRHRRVLARIYRAGVGERLPRIPGPLSLLRTVGRMR